MRWAVDRHNQIELDAADGAVQASLGDAEQLLYRGACQSGYSNWSVHFVLVRPERQVRQPPRRR